MTIRNYFPGGNTAQGFYSFYNYLPFQAEKVYIIKGGPGTGKSTFMKKIGSQAIDQGLNIEFHWCSSDNESLDGVVIPELKAAIFDGTAPHLIDPVFPGAVEEIINLGQYWDSSYLHNHREEITHLTREISKRFTRIYHNLKTAKLIHDEWEFYYQQGFNIHGANQLADQLIAELIPATESRTRGAERHLFASAFTPEGPVNYLANLTAEIKNRYIIKGRPGTGKSTLNQKIASAALSRGYYVEYLHCSFDPDSIDTIIIPELNLAFIDGTAPHILDPVREGDQLIDMLQLCDQQTIDSYSEEIIATEEIYQQVMAKAARLLKSAKLLHDELEKYYIQAMDFKQVEAKRNEIITSIFSSI